MSLMMVQVKAPDHVAQYRSYKLTYLLLFTIVVYIALSLRTIYPAIESVRAAIPYPGGWGEGGGAMLGGELCWGLDLDDPAEQP